MFCHFGIINHLLQFKIMNKSILSLSIIASLLLSACGAKKEEKEEVGKYTVTNPLLIDTTYTKEYVAQIQSIQNIEIRAKVEGFVESINVDEGQQVKAGQLMFTIRPREYEAELQIASAKVKTAELEMQNVKTLADKGIVSKTELALSVAKLNEVKADAALAELHVSYTKVFAPFNGVVDRLKFKVGSLIDEGTLLTSLSNNKEVYAYFNVSEQEYLDFKSRKNNNSEVSLVLANGQLHQFKGKIETIEGEFDNSTGSIAFRAKFPNPNLLLRHGETGKMQLKFNLDHAIIIPQRATYEIQDKTYVYVVDDKNKVSSRYITIKQKLANIYVIESGLSINDKILLEGIQSVKEDEEIQTVFVPAKESLQAFNK